MNVYVLYLEWPERCFRLNAADFAAFRALVPSGSRVIWAQTEEELVRALPRATHVITWCFRREWYALAPRLKSVATPAAGRELVSTEAPAGVRVHFGGFHGAIISETVLAFVLGWTHGFFQARHLPLWPRSRLAEVVDRDLAGSRAVILGYGRIGKAVGDRLAAFGVQIFGYSRHLKIARTVLRRELRRADWLIVALPSDTGTDGIVNASLLAEVSPRCVLVNVGRGNAVDEAALLSALREGRLAGAYLDVFRNEPTVLAKKSVRPKRGETDLAKLPASAVPWNLVRMPHASAYSPSYLKAAFLEMKHDGVL